MAFYFQSNKIKENKKIIIKKENIEIDKYKFMIGYIGIKHRSMPVHPLPSVPGGMYDLHWLAN